MLGLGILLACHRNYLGNEESNSMCFNSCFKEKNCLGRVKKARETGVNTPCTVLTFQRHQSGQKPETVGLKVKTLCVNSPPVLHKRVSVPLTAVL